MAVPMIATHQSPLDQFRLEGKSVRLQEPLDRDESDLSSIVFQVTFSSKESTAHHESLLMLTQPNVDGSRLHIEKEKFA